MIYRQFFYSFYILIRSRNKKKTNLNVFLIFEYAINEHIFW